MGLTQYYTATTLDGFIADPDNSLEWLFTRAQDEDGPQSYAAFIAQVGALAMGATTYEWILDHEGVEVAVRACRAGCSRTASCRSCPMRAITFMQGDVRPVHARDAVGGR